MPDRVDDLLSQLTLEEKAALVAGVDWWHTAAIERLGIPALKMSDGPAGVRGAHVSGGPPSASFPCGTALGATWDVELVHRVGVELAGELESKGAQLILAPTVNLHRTPLAGRNFECYSEDPFLTSRLAVAYITGVQSRGVGATIKHFVANDSEHERMTISSEVPERALRELYLAPFEAAVEEANVWAVMSGYNKVAGHWCSENETLLTQILREEWGFEGLVVSDWFGTHSTVEASKAGLDLEMPGPPQYGGEAMVRAVEAGDLTTRALDDRCRRVLALVERAGLFDEPRADVVESYDDSLERRAFLRHAAASSIVLLSNEPVGSSPVLPLDRTVLTSVALIGPTAARASAQGGGSAQVSSPYEVSPLEGLRAALGAGVEVRFEPGADIGRGAAWLDPNRLVPSTGAGKGWTVSYVAGDDPSGGTVAQSSVTPRTWFRWDPQFAPAGPGAPWSVRAEGRFTAAWSGTHTFSARTAGRVRLRVGDRSVDGWDASEGRRTLFVAVEAEAGEDMPVHFEWAAAGPELNLDIRVVEPLPTDLAARAVALAAACDVAVVVAGMDSTWETEGRDRRDLTLPGGQADLITRVAAANPRTVVVVNAGASVDLSWAPDVPAIVQLWYPGQEGGHALADVLLGAVDAGGRLPTTFARRLEDHPAMLNYPGERGEVRYGEGLFIGYRAFDRTGVEPAFSFGHGLSYTTWAFGPPSLSSPTATSGIPLTVTVPVTNSGDRPGDAVVQVYVRDVEATVIRPDKELKGFVRLRDVAPGQTVDATVELDERAFAFWDPALHAWAVESGEFEILVGRSATDIAQRATVVWTG